MIPVRGADPKEVDLLAGHARVTVGRRAEDEVIEDGGVRCHADPAAYHHGNLELVPVL